jgi:hypothetical protein
MKIHEIGLKKNVKNPTFHLSLPQELTCRSRRPHPTIL